MPSKNKSNYLGGGKMLGPMGMIKWGMIGLSAIYLLNHCDPVTVVKGTGQVIGEFVPYRIDDFVPFMVCEPPISERYSMLIDNPIQVPSPLENMATNYSLQK
jgi:hypothetical protein